MTPIFFALMCTFAVTGSFTASNSTSYLQGKDLQSFIRTTFPYLVSLKKADKHYCSGVFIAVKKVLTAAYCIHKEVQSKNFSGIRAVIEYKAYEIESGIFDKYYSDTNAYPQFDFGILTLKDPAHAMTAAIPDIIERDYYPSPGGVTFLIGWDKLNSDNIKTVVMKTENWVTCLEHFICKNENFVGNSICAVSETKGESIDETDVGTPLMRNGKVIGILSSSSLKDRKYFIFTNLYKFTSYLSEEDLDDSIPVSLERFQRFIRTTHPYLVSLRKADQHYCSGVVIAVKKVLTAAYCIHKEVQSQNFSRIKAVIEFKVHGIDSGISDDCYNNTNAYPQFDFGILTLKEPTHVMAAIIPGELEGDCYPTFSSVPYSIVWDKVDCNNMKVVVMESEDKKICLQHFVRKEEDFMDDLICAESQDKDELIDESDIGSPLIQNEIVIGILSGGSLENTEHYIFTNIYKYTSYLAFATSKSQEEKEEYFIGSESIDANHRNKIRRRH